MADRNICLPTELKRFSRVANSLCESAMSRLELELKILLRRVAQSARTSLKMHPK